MYAKVRAINRQPPVSRRITASVEAHCGAKMYQTRADSGVARLQCCANAWPIWLAALLPPSTAYTVPKAAGPKNWEPPFSYFVFAAGFAPRSNLCAKSRRRRQEESLLLQLSNVLLRVELPADLLDEFKLGFEEVNMILLVLRQRLEQVHGHAIVH